jgi:hypothetical protein
LDAVEDTTVIHTRTPRGLFVIIGLMAGHSLVHDSRLRFQSMNHVSGSAINSPWPVTLLRILSIYFRFRRQGGHDWICLWLRLVANDPKHALAAAGVDVFAPRSFLWN